MKKAGEYYRLYKEISRLSTLQDRRHPMFYRKMAMKVFIICMNLVLLGYLLIIGYMLKDFLQLLRPGMEPYNLFNKGMVFLLIVDMLFRLSGQETPAVKIRPFLLLPIPKRMVMDCYLFRILLLPINLLWFAMLLPFAAKCVFPFYGITGCMGYLLGWWLLLASNGYFYLLTRTLMLKCWAWVLLPIITYTVISLLVFLPQTEAVAYFFMYLGEGWMKGQLWSYGLMVLGLALMFILNRKLQLKAVYKETNGQTLSRKKSYQKRIDFTLFNRLGITGEFINMEIKSALRNKTVRVQLISNSILSVFVSLILCLSPDVYSESAPFWCYYCFFTQATPLLHTLSLEGNYMDGLMVRRQLLKDLLKGKYLFYCLLEFIPLICILPAIILGTISIGLWLSCFMISIGFFIPLMLHTSVFTNYAIAMNKKLTQGNSAERIGMTILWLVVALAIPLVIQFTVSHFFSLTAGYIALCILGLIGVITEPCWLHSLYQKVYQRRYQNMEGFRNSRLK